MQMPYESTTEVAVGNGVSEGAPLGVTIPAKSSKKTAQKGAGWALMGGAGKKRGRERDGKGWVIVQVSN